MTEAVQYRTGEGVAAPAAEAPDRPAGGPAAVGRAGAGGDWGNAHPVNVRLSIPLLFARYYVTIVAGKERRKPDRLESERRRHPLETAGNVAFALVVGIILGLAALMAIRLAILAVVGHTGGPVTFA